MKISSLNNRVSWQSLTKQNTCVFEDFLLEHCFLEHLSIDISLIRQIMNLNSRLKFKTSFLTDILLIIMRQNITHISPKDHVLSIWSSCSFLAFMGHDPRRKSAWFEETLFVVAETPRHARTCRPPRSCRPSLCSPTVPGHVFEWLH